MKDFKVLSLGAGVQSTTMLMMALQGELERPDCAIFADTGWEPPDVYKQLAWVQEVAGEYDFPVHIVKKGNLRTDALGSAVGGELNGVPVRSASMPLFTLLTGKRGMINRQCTGEYKVEPIQRKIRDLLEYKPRQHVKEAVEVWIGITRDEVGRMKDSRVPWIKNKWPLLFDVPLSMSRRDCLQWMGEKFPGWKLVKSACIGCPFHDNKSWRYIRDDPQMWEDAVSFDKAIRHRDKLGAELFVHSDCVPLDEANIDVEESQSDLFGQECEGMCGV